MSTAEINANITAPGGTPGDINVICEPAKRLVELGEDVLSITFPGYEKLYTKDGVPYENLEVATLGKRYEEFAGDGGIFRMGEDPLVLIPEAAKRFEVVGPMYLKSILDYMHQNRFRTLEGHRAILNNASLNILGPALYSLDIEEIIIAEPYNYRGTIHEDERGKKVKHASQFVQPYDDSMFYPKRLAIDTLSRFKFKPIGDNLSRTMLGSRHKDISFSELVDLPKKTIVMSTPLLFGEHDNSFFTGYPMFESKTPLPEQIQQFLDDNKGKRVITAAFGSMELQNEHKAELMQSRVRAIKGLSDHVMVVAGMDLDKLGIDYDPRQIAYYDGFINYGKLFLESDIVTSHFGAGTWENALLHETLCYPLTFISDQMHRAKSAERYLGTVIGIERYKKLDLSGQAFRKSLLSITESQLTQAKIIAAEQRRLTEGSTERIVQRIREK